MTETLRLATRGSELALQQARTVQSALEDRRRDVELLEVETTGDQIRDALIQDLGKTGAFVQSVEQHVMTGDADAAVHSMKDVPTEDISDTVLAAIPERGPRGDVLVTPDGCRLEELPDGAVVGTSSLRRQAQLLRVRPELTVAPLRGNVDTRVQKLLAPTLQAEAQRRQDAAEEAADNPDVDPPGQSVDTWRAALTPLEREALDRDVETEYDAIVLAEAGLQRSGLLEQIQFQRLPRDTFVPAPGQGALAVTTTNDHVDMFQRALDDPVARVETIVERTLLAELGGGCVTPIGISAIVKGAYVATRVQILATDGTEAITETRELPVERHRQAAQSFAADLIDQGAATLIDQATAKADTDTADAGAASATDGGDQ